MLKRKGDKKASRLEKMKGSSFVPFDRDNIKMKKKARKN